METPGTGHSFPHFSQGMDRLNMEVSHFTHLPNLFGGCGSKFKKLGQTAGFSLLHLPRCHVWFHFLEPQPFVDPKTCRISGQEGWKRTSELFACSFFQWGHPHPLFWHCRLFCLFEPQILFSGKPIHSQGTSHGRCWDTFFLFAYCGLVVEVNVKFFNFMVLFLLSGFC